MSVASKLKVVLTATVLAGAAFVATMPAQASDFDDEGFGSSYHRPRVEREVTVTTVTRRYDYHRPVYGRPVYDDNVHEPRYRGRYIERRPHAQPVFYGRPGYGPPVYGHPVFDDRDDCHVIIKKRVNAWGDVVVKRIRRCD